MRREYKSNPIVWCPKYRRRVLVEGVDARLEAIIHEVAAERREEGDA